MISSRLLDSTWGRVLALLAVLLGLAWCVVHGPRAYALLLVPAAIALLLSFQRRQTRLLREVEQFAEAVRYRDFSRYFTTHRTPSDLQAIRHGFNEIIGTFKAISRERETQYHHLHNVLELVDTGILSYELASGEVLWANETIKRQLLLPSIRSLASLTRRYPELAQRLSDLGPGERCVLTLQPEKATVQLLFSATIFETDGRLYKLIACQNISEALDESEARAWQRLLSVMTHEIMNSVAPISSLAETLQARLEEAAPQLDDTDGAVEDLRLGIDTIRRRSAGLLKFATTYRSLNKVSTPDVRPVRLSDLFESLHRLMMPTLRDKGITLDIQLPDPTLTLEADPSLVEQVLINLLVNAIDAVKRQPAPRITLSAGLSSNRRVSIRILDNGEGMSAEVLENIFVPFFTTKKSGSGIGLSICRQIMLLHRGAIQAQSELGQGTVFTLLF